MPQYRARYDLTPLSALVRFIEADGETYAVGYVVRPQGSPASDYHANKRASRRLTDLTGDDVYDEADFYCDDGQGPRYGYDTTGGECEWGID